MAIRGRNGTVVLSSAHNADEPGEQAATLAVDVATGMRGLGLDAEAIVAHVRLALANEQQASA